MIDNGHIIPSNVGLDGQIGGECEGKWYGGTYGWGFTVEVPQTGELAHRNRTHWGFTGFMNAYMLTGDDRYLDVWRTTTRQDQRQKKDRRRASRCTRECMATKAGTATFAEKYGYNDFEIYYLSMRKRRLEASA